MVPMSNRVRRSWSTISRTDNLGNSTTVCPGPALLAVGPGDVVTIVTDNVGHLGRFVDAKTWTAIQP